MKKIQIYLLLTSLLVSVSFYAQRAKGSNVNYEYYRLPLQKVQEKKFHYKVDVGFINDYNADLNEHKEEERMIEEQFALVNEVYSAIKQEMIANYEAEEKKAEDEYQEAMKVYNSKSTGDKLAQQILLKDDGKPKKRNIGPPPTNKDFADKIDMKYKESMGTNYLPKKKYLAPFDERNDLPSESDMTGGIELQGFDKSSNEGLKIKMDASDYVVSEEVKTNGEAPNVNKIAHINVSVEVFMTVYNESGDEIYSNSNKIKSMVKSSSKKEAEWDKYQKSSAYKSVILKQKKSCLKSCVAGLNKSLNNEFGYAWVKKSSRVYTGTGKKLDYTDLNEAQVAFKNGLRDLKIDKDNAYVKFNEAIKIWQSTLDEELDTEFKKARINNKVGAALYINMALAYTLMNDFDNADQAITEVQNNSNFKGGDVKEAEVVRKFMNDQKRRSSN